ncbi:MAG TPA: BCAM0308 family protein [Candidatus Deferrimicrobiaceae bacterium]|nr:BCAM0308 family protein [Candidatus Deferrimicrobiaceae bacterium]
MPRFTYSPAHKKNVTRETDPYIPKKTAPSISVCPGCRAICRNKRWYLDEKEFALLTRKKDGGIARRQCPACRKIADGFVGGVVTLRGGFAREHREEILNLIRNEEQRAMGFNPLARIVQLKEDESGFEVLTTVEKLAQRIGRVVQKTFSGMVEYKWSEDSKLLRVNWVREA